MKPIFTLLVSFIILSTCAQSTFDKLYGYENSTTSYSARQTTDGQYVILAGMSSGWNQNMVTIMLLKLDQFGEIIREDFIESENIQQGLDFIETEDNGHIIVGSTYSDSGNFNDILLLKADSIGNIIWQKSYHISDGDLGTSIKRSHDGGYIISGYTYTYGQQFIYHPILLKTNATGDLEWLNYYEDINGGAMSVIVTSDSNYVFSGYIDYDNQQQMDLLIRKVKYDGSNIWTKIYGGQDNQIGFDIIEYNNSDLIITGSHSNTNSTHHDSYFLRTTNNGDSIWTRTLGSPRSNYCRSVCISNDSNLVLAGNIDSGENNSLNTILIKLNLDGDTIWTQKYAESGQQHRYGRFVTNTNDNGFFIAGETIGFQAHKQISAIKTDENGRVDYLTIDENCSPVISIYPNPCTDQINIITKQKIIEIFIYDITGRAVKHITPVSANNFYSTNGLQYLDNGLYIIDIKHYNGRSTSKFYKMN